MRNGFEQQYPIGQRLIEVASVKAKHKDKLEELIAVLKAIYYYIASRTFNDSGNFNLSAICSRKIFVIERDFIFSWGDSNVGFAGFFFVYVRKIRRN